MSDGIRVAAVDDIAILRDEEGSVWALNDTCTHEDASLPGPARRKWSST